jgi:hypothetical protein
VAGRRASTKAGEGLSRARRARRKVLIRTPHARRSHYAQLMGFVWLRQEHVPLCQSFGRGRGHGGESE